MTETPPAHVLSDYFKISVDEINTFSRARAFVRFIKSRLAVIRTDHASIFVARAFDRVGLYVRCDSREVDEAVATRRTADPSQGSWKYVLATSTISPGHQGTERDKQFFPGSERGALLYSLQREGALPGFPVANTA